MQRASELGALICMHAENGTPIDVLVQQALAKGHTAPIYHALTRPRSPRPRRPHRAIALAEMAGAPVYIVHLSASARSSRSRGARPRAAGLRRDLPAVPLPRPTTICADPDFEGAKYVCTPPLAPRHMQDELWRGLRGNDLQVVSHRPLPVLQKGQKELGSGRLREDPERRMPGVETRLSLLWDGGVARAASR